MTTMKCTRVSHEKLPLITLLTVAFTLLNLLLNVDTQWLFQQQKYPSKQEKSGRPEVWDLKNIEPVAITPEESVHYRLDTREGAIEWASVLPRGKGVVFLTESRTPYRLSLFHQLECLDVVRSEMHDRQAHPSGPSTSQKAHFCLNYLRQSIQCHADAHLEMVRSEYGGRAVLPYTTRTDCKDWERVWSEAESNFDSWWKAD